jgi:DNA-binding NarL/FixJ family response regulator
MRCTRSICVACGCMASGSNAGSASVIGSGSEVTDVVPSVTRVLICENDPIMRSALCDLVDSVSALELVGYAEDADAAGEQAIATTPDAVVIDVRMPGGGGPRAARLIREHVPDARLIAYLAFADREVVVAMLQAGVDEYLIKGVDDGQLVDAMRRTGRGRIGLPALELQELLFDLAQMLAGTQARLETAQRQLADQVAPA